MNSKIDFYLEQLDSLNEGLFYDKIYDKPKISSKKAYDKCVEILKNIPELKFNSKLGERVKDTFGTTSWAYMGKYPSEDKFDKFDSNNKSKLYIASWVPKSAVINGKVYTKLNEAIEKYGYRVDITVTYSYGVPTGAYLYLKHNFKKVKK